MRTGAGRFLSRRFCRSYYSWAGEEDRAASRADLFVIQSLGACRARTSDSRRSRKGSQISFGRVLAPVALPQIANESLRQGSPSSGDNPLRSRRSSLISLGRASGLTLRPCSPAILIPCNFAALISRSSVRTGLPVASIRLEFAG
jgi:hypothetical protein